jgi:predicted permease
MIGYRIVEIEQSRRELPLQELEGIHSISGLAAFLAWGFPVGSRGEARSLYGFKATSNLFRVLGVRAAIGRVFEPSDDGKQVAILCYEYWRKISGDPRIIGSTMIIGEEPYTIIGVLPAEFVLQVRDANLCIPSRLAQGRLIARLARGVTAAQVEAEVTAVLRNLPPAGRAAGREVPPRVREITASFRPGAASTILLLQAAIGLVLLIACANMGNLMLVRANGRRREFAIRSAIGAGRLQMVRPLLAETVLLGLAGGAAGLLLAQWNLAFIGTRLPAGLGRMLRGADGLAIDFRVILFTAAISLAAMMLFGVAPAVSALRQDLIASLREASSGATPRGRRFGNWLVTGELALTLVLLMGAGLTLKNLVLLQKMDLGFRADHVLRAAVDLLPARYPQAWQKRAVFAEIARRIETLPGVEAVGVIAPQLFPFGGPGVRGAVFEVEGRADVEPRAEVYTANPAYFRSLRIPLLRGRVFTAADTAESDPVVILSERVARRYWEAGDALGRRVRLDPRRPESVWATVVGVVGDVRNPGRDVQPTAYRPFAQNPYTGAVLMLRASGEPMALAEAVRRELRAVDPTAPQFRTASLAMAVADYYSPQRFTTRMLAFFAALGLFLASLGVYAVMRCWVSTHISEIGIRMALGADRRHVVRLVLFEAGKPLLCGVAAGIVAAWLLQRVIAGELHAVSPLDPEVFAGVSVLLIAVALLAAWLPTQRAAAIDPLASLKHEG